MARQKSDQGGGADRLSTLPDSVLCHILSFLPTITSVATMSLVSHRWRHLWKYLQVFHFDDSHFRHRRKKKFPLFVNAVLALRKSRDIQKFNLTIDGDCVDYDYSIDIWLHAAAGPHLQEFSLTTGNPWKFPFSLAAPSWKLWILTLLMETLWPKFSLNIPPAPRV
ncbi:hypothetical protein TSUD_370290 [Trifolium subterraneum]|uniref:F-box domain-containing protein n=1 Tax=Trifolium subterraneum TaxID=3900 RepID=A0A2Z6N6I4_TRISU|nr:hypothetical protein TSUD_370290 [Trifolium subterraneum]